MADIGGTTTDLAAVRDGRAVTADEGAVVGGWRTMVRAMEVTTRGLGGDSEVEIRPDGTIALRPTRVVPLSLLADRHPAVIGQLRADLADEFMSSLHGRFVLRPFGAAGTASDAASADLSMGERELLEAVGAEPVSARRVLRQSGSQRALASLVRKGALQVSALTPSDAAHVLGRQSTWSVQGALLGARLGVRMRQMRGPTDEEAEQLCRDVLDATVTASAAAVLDVLLDASPETSHALDARLVAAVAAGRPDVGLVSVSLRPRVPVVAVGGPARLVYPEVGRRLGADVVLPPHAEVANAVGAATAVVVRAVVVDVEGDPGGGYRVHGPDGVDRAAGGSEAIALAERIGAEAARRAAVEAGGSEPRVEVTVQRHLLPGASDDRGLFSAVVRAEAVALPAAREAERDGEREAERDGGHEPA